MKKTLLVSLLALATASASFADSGRKVPVQFAANRSEKTVSASLQGRSYIDFVVNAKAGQLLTVSQRSSNPQTYFNVNSPGTDLALYNSSSSGSPMRNRVLPNDGDYVVRVYLMKPAAQRGERSNFDLFVSVTGRPLAGLPASQDAKVGKTPFHATAKVPFKYYLNSKVSECDGGVIRRGTDGTATVVLKSKGFTRTILFVKGHPVGSDSSEEMKASKNGDLHEIEFGDKSEIYEIADAFLTGG